MAGHVMRIGSVALGFQTDEAAIIVWLVEHQVGAVTGQCQTLLAVGMVDLGLALPAAITVVEPSARALPLPKVEVGRKPAAPLGWQVIRPLLPDPARQKTHLCLGITPEEGMETGAIEAGALPQVGQADTRHQALPLQAIVDLRQIVKGRIVAGELQCHRAAGLRHSLPWLRPAFAVQEERRIQLACG